MHKDKLLELLLRLDQLGEISYSSIPKASRDELQQFGEMKNCFFVEKGERRGLVFKVRNKVILQNEIKLRTPNVDIDALSSRAKNLALRNDTKAGETTLKNTYLVCKAIGQNIVIKKQGKQFDASLATETMGCFSLSIDDDCESVECNSNLILVENQQLLDETTWLATNWNGIILYYGGNVSKRVLEWLKKSSFSSITLFPDYDSVGISNFTRVKTAIPSTEWYWINNWEHLLVRYGKAELWAEPRQFNAFNEQWTFFKKNGFPIPQLESLMVKMRENGKMLEQECALFKEK